MRAVGIKQLKAHLSEYLRLAKSGETVLVTEREEVIAELRPARRQLPRARSVDEVLEELGTSGEVERSAADGAFAWKPHSLRLPRGTARRLLDAEREDR